jgi:DNA-directed RNA polymerase subunit RPC12/RpoP
LSVLKCSECGNTFKSERVSDGDTVVCPVCEANYKVQIKDGKTKLTLTIYEEDPGEL